MHNVYGYVETENGMVHPFLEFVDDSMTWEEAKREAVRIKSAQWKGVVVRCVACDPGELNIADDTAR